ATLVVIMFTGVSFGGALPGFVSLWLVPQHGWPILFWIGGVLPLVIAAALVFALPESIKFLALHERRAEAARLARILDRDVAIGPQTRFIVTGSEQHERFRLPQLFRGSLAVV